MGKHEVFTDHEDVFKDIIKEKLVGMYNEDIEKIYKQIDDEILNFSTDKSKDVENNLIRFSFDDMYARVERSEAYKAYTLYLKQQITDKGIDKVVDDLYNMIEDLSDKTIDRIVDENHKKEE